MSVNPTVLTDSYHLITSEIGFMTEIDLWIKKPRIRKKQVRATVAPQLWPGHEIDTGYTATVVSHYILVNNAYFNICKECCWFGVNFYG